MGLFGKKKKKMTTAEMAERYYQWAMEDRTRRQEYLESAVALGSLRGKAALAQYYLRQYPGDTEKIKQSAAWLEEAEAAGMTVDQSQLAGLYETLGRKEAAAARYLKSAEQGDVSAQFQTGWNYANGNVFAQDDEKAAYWYEKAAQQGKAAASNALAACYLQGRGVAQNDQKALEYLELAAQQGSQAACASLAWNYFHGERPCPQDDEKAASYAAKGEKQDGENGYRCRYVLAMLRSEGRGGLKEDYHDASGSLGLLLDAGFEKAREGRDICRARWLERTRGLYEKALETGDMDMMDQAARNGSVDADVYFLQESVQIVQNEKRKLTDIEMRKYLPYFQYSLKEAANLPLELLTPLLDAMEDLGQRLVDQKEYQEAYDLVSCTYSSGHAGCMWVLACAAEQIEGKKQAVAYYRKFWELPGSKLPKYAEKKRTAGFKITMADAEEVWQKQNQKNKKN